MKLALRVEQVTFFLLPPRNIDFGNTHGSKDARLLESCPERSVWDPSCLNSVAGRRSTADYWASPAGLHQNAVMACQTPAVPTVTMLS